MLKHAVIVAVAVLSALGAVQALNGFASARARATPAALQPAVVAQAAAPEPASPPQAAQVSKAEDGHYWAQADVNGRWIRFLVDTGASAVALTVADARRLGLDVGALTYDRPVMTASGRTSAALVKLDRVTVAGARVDDVDALVVRDGLSTSLLGMSYLGRLSRFEATKTALILRP
jgi:aspartyl protease family protein